MTAPPSNGPSDETEGPAGPSREAGGPGGPRGPGEPGEPGGWPAPSPPAASPPPPVAPPPPVTPPPTTSQPAPAGGTGAPPRLTGDEPTEIIERPAPVDTAPEEAAGTGGARPEAAGEAARWVGIAFSSALGLAVVQAIVVIGVVLEGLAVSSSGPQGLRGDVFYRIGLAAYIPNFTTTNGLLLLVAVGLVLLPLAARTRIRGNQRSAAVFTLTGVAVLAAVIGIGALLAVRAQFHRFDLFHQKIDSVSRRLLFTYLAGTLGTAAVAVAGAVGAIGLYRRIHPEDAGGTGATEVTEAPAPTP